MRLGASEVHLVYRRTREDMPAQDLEVEEAVEEGLQLHLLTNPTQILGNGKVEGLELVTQQLGEFDSSARRRPSPLEGSEFVLPVDVIIPAIGQSVDTSGGTSLRRAMRCLAPRRSSRLWRKGTRSPSQ